MACLCPPPPPFLNCPFECLPLFLKEGRSTSRGLVYFPGLLQDPEQKNHHFVVSYPVLSRECFWIFVLDYSFFVKFFYLILGERELVLISHSGRRFVVWLSWIWRIWTCASKALRINLPYGKTFVSKVSFALQTITLSPGLTNLLANSFVVLWHVTGANILWNLVTRNRGPRSPCSLIKSRKFYFSLTSICHLCLWSPCFCLCSLKLIFHPVVVIFKPSSNYVISLLSILWGLPLLLKVMTQRP